MLQVAQAATQVHELTSERDAFRGDVLRFQQKCHQLTCIVAELRTQMGKAIRQRDAAHTVCMEREIFVVGLKVFSRRDM